MTAAEVHSIRIGLGLTQTALGHWLRLGGKQPGHTVRMWEMGRNAPPGPAVVCLRAFAGGYRPEHVDALCGA